jgi:hypothetical protein
VFSGAQILQKSVSHLKILGVRRVTCSMFRTEEPHILGATVQNSVAKAMWFPGFVHPCVVLTAICVLHLLGTAIFSVFAL